jgi:hypothetical protein
MSRAAFMEGMYVGSRVKIKMVEFKSQDLLLAARVQRHEAWSKYIEIFKGPSAHFTTNWVIISEIHQSLC